MSEIGSLGKSWFLVSTVKKIIINHNVINIYSKISIIVYNNYKKWHVLTINDRIFIQKMTIPNESMLRNDYF